MSVGLTATPPAGTHRRMMNDETHRIDAERTSKKPRTGDDDDDDGLDNAGPTAKLDDVRDALQNGNLPIIQDYIRTHPTFLIDASIMDTDGNKNMLHCACIYGHLHIVEYLLKELQANVHTITSTGGNTTPFCMSIWMARNCTLLVIDVDTFGSCHDLSAFGVQTRQGKCGLFSH